VHLSLTNFTSRRLVVLFSAAEERRVIEDKKKEVSDRRKIPVVEVCVLWTDNMLFIY